MEAAELGQEKDVAFTTFRRSGEPVVNPTAPVIDGTAELQTSGPRMDQVSRAIVGKYGLLARLITAASS